MTAAIEPVPRPHAPRWASPRRATVAALAAAGAGAALLALGLVVAPDRTWFAYLQAWTFGTTVCLGALILLMTSHASKAGWMVVTRRLTEAVATTTPLFLVLFAPIALALSHLYPWARPRSALDAATADLVAHKSHYLNTPFFIVRTIVYFAIFIAVENRLRAWSRANDAQPRLDRVRWMRALAGGGLPIVGLALTWASFDWTMSLEPGWYSTIFGLYYFSGGFVGALALVAILLHLAKWRGRDEAAPRAANAARPPPSRAMPITGDQTSALGRVLFAMIIFWAYMAFSQLLIIWIGDIPEETEFFHVRAAGSWAVVCGILLFGHFVFPFLALLNRRWKRSTRFLAAWGAWMLVMHWVDVYWLIVPEHDRSGVRLHWTDAAGLLFVAGVAFAWAQRAYFAAAPLPAHDPELASGFNYEASL